MRFWPHRDRPTTDPATPAPRPEDAEKLVEQLEVRAAKIGRHLRRDPWSSAVIDTVHPDRRRHRES